MKDITRDNLRSLNSNYRFILVRISIRDFIFKLMYFFMYIYYIYLFYVI